MKGQRLLAELMFFAGLIKDGLIEVHVDGIHLDNETGAEYCPQLYILIALSFFSIFWLIWC